MELNRNIIQNWGLSGIELEVYICLKHMFKNNTEEKAITGSQILYDLTNNDSEEYKKGRVCKINKALASLIHSGSIAGKMIDETTCLIYCDKSFINSVNNSKYGTISIDYSIIQAISKEYRLGEGIMTYYLTIMSYMYNKKICPYPCAYFRKILKISKISVKRYNEILEKIGAIKVIYNNMGYLTVSVP